MGMEKREQGNVGEGNRNRGEGKRRRGGRERKKKIGE